MAISSLQTSKLDTAYVSSLICFAIHWICAVT